MTSKQHHEVLDTEEFEDLKRAVAAGHSVELLCDGKSMSPVLRSGQTMRVQQATSLRRFDLVVFLYRGELVCHYIRHINEMTDAAGGRIYIMQGYSNRCADAIPVGEENILGVPVGFRLKWWQKLRCAFRSG